MGRPDCATLSLGIFMVLCGAGCVATSLVAEKNKDNIELLRVCLYIFSGLSTLLVSAGFMLMWWGSHKQKVQKQRQLARRGIRVSTMP